MQWNGARPRPLLRPSNAFQATKMWTSWMSLRFSKTCRRHSFRDDVHYYWILHLLAFCPLIARHTQDIAAPSSRIQPRRAKRLENPLPQAPRLPSQEGHEQLSLSELAREGHVNAPQKLQETRRAPPRHSRPFSLLTLESVPSRRGTCTLDH